MADYEIPFTDNANKGSVTVNEGAFNNTDTSLTLPGRLLSDYGEFINTNFLHLLENFADVNPPSNPVEGQLWYDTTANIDQLKIYDGTNWVSAGGLKKGSSQPAVANSVIGDIWVDTTNTQVYVYSGSGWVLIGPNYTSGTKSGALPEDIIDTGDVSRTVVTHYIDDVRVAIVSNVEFTPKASITGFSIIKVGFNPNTNLTNNVFNGTAYVAENLKVGGGVIASSEFMRNNIINNISELLRVRNNNGIEIGATKTLSMLVEGSSGIIEHALTGSNLDVRVNNAGTFTTAIRVKSDTTVGINNLNPDESLSVTGNIRLDAPTSDATKGNLILNGTVNSTSPTTGSVKIAGGVGIAQDMYIGGNLVIEGSSPGSTPTLTAGSIVPDITGQRNIGTSAKSYDNLYASRITGNLTGDVTGDVSGSAGTSQKLNSITTFQMSGDVTGTSFTFDGQTGGSTKTFTTAIAPTFITDKTTTGTINNATDFIMIARGTDLFKASPSIISSSIPTQPIGIVNMYGGLTAPTGWMLCDGSEISLVTYATLATALGYSAADSATWYWGTPSDPNTLFKIPDFRGRFALGLGLPGGANRVAQSAAGTMGGISGAQNKTIAAANLPEHEHDLTSSTGEQFYTTSTATNTAPEVVATNGDTAGTGTRMETSGGVVGLANDPLDVTNPFAAINFIIYHGVT